MIALHRARALLAAGTTLAVEVGAVAALTALGSRRPFAVPFGRIDDWVATTPPADALVAALRWAALLGAWWLLAGTVLYVVAVATRVPRAVRGVRWATLPPVRRAVDAAFAATLAAGALLAPASAGAAGSDPPSPTIVRDGRSGGLASLPPADAPPPPTPPTTTTVTAPAPAVDATVVVAPGDNLWELAARQVASAGRRARADVTDAEITPYWVVVCERNRDALASGDPNLVFPGEVVVLPGLS